MLPTRSRTTLYVQPIGNFQPLHSEAIAATADLLGRFYWVPVRMLDPIGTRIVPSRARRRNPFTRHEQFLTGHILDHLSTPISEAGKIIKTLTVVMVSGR